MKESKEVQSENELNLTSLQNQVTMLTESLNEARASVVTSQPVIASGQEVDEGTLS